jgi:hypothetical protein
MVRLMAAAAMLVLAGPAAAQNSAEQETQLYDTAKGCASMYIVMAQAAEDDKEEQQNFVARGAKFMLLMAGIKGGDEEQAGKDIESGVGDLVAEVQKAEGDSAATILLERMAGCIDMETAIDKAMAD